MSDPATISATALLNSALNPSTPLVVGAPLQAAPTPAAAPVPQEEAVTQEESVTQEAPENPVLRKRLEQFLKLRSMKSEMEKRHKEELAPLNDAREKLEAALLDVLQGMGSDSATLRGLATVYKATESSATVADGDVFRRHVIGTQEWDLIDFRANKTGVKRFIAENAAAPPGVNFTQSVRIGVRTNNQQGS